MKKTFLFHLQVHYFFRSELLKLFFTPHLSLSLNEKPHIQWCSSTCKLHKLLLNPLVMCEKSRTTNLVFEFMLNFLKLCVMVWYGNTIQFNVLCVDCCILNRDIFSITIYSVNCLNFFFLINLWHVSWCSEDKSKRRCTSPTSTSRNLEMSIMIYRMTR